MEPTCKVPGISEEAHNAFDISQVLSWLTNQTRDVQQQVDRMRDIPNLMDSLLERN
jgi:hypothetical protein